MIEALRKVRDCVTQVFAKREPGKNFAIAVTPETAVRWLPHPLDWSVLSKVRKRVGKKQVPKESRDRIFPMVAEKPDLGCTSDSISCLNTGWIPCRRLTASGGSRLVLVISSFRLRARSDVSVPSASSGRRG